MSKDERKEITVKGVAASPGVSHGPVFTFLQKVLEVPTYEVAEKDRSREVSRFEQAIMETRKQIHSIRMVIAEKLGEDEASIFDAHQLVLEDAALLDATIRELEDTSLNIEHCFQDVSNRYINAFANINDEYIKERVSDILDVSRRLLGNLLGLSDLVEGKLTEKKVVVAEDLSPSDTASLEKSHLLGIATDRGSRTSHSVIMARSLDIPAVVGLHNITDLVHTDDILLIDGYNGIVIINPCEQNLYQYGQVEHERQSVQKIYKNESKLPAETRDGHKIAIRANIEGIEDTERLKGSGADGVGLFRTEGIYLSSNEFPDEEEQYESYRKVVAALNPRLVVIRTLDLGGDKVRSLFLGGEKSRFGSSDIHEESNPFMGLRAIRFCLENPDIFKSQLRAILRASAHGKVKLLYPMISGVPELRDANRLLEECKHELKESGHDFDSEIELGSMIEIPSAASIVDLLSEHCHFFSIGTNDLIQYMLAVDRVNDSIAHLYEPNHPAVVRTIKNVIDTAHDNGLPVSICGEMAGEPIYAILLVGLGADELSVTTSLIPEIKYLIRQLNKADVVKLADEVLEMGNTEEIYNTLRNYYQQLMGEILETYS